MGRFVLDEHDLKEIDDLYRGLKKQLLKRYGELSSEAAGSRLGSRTAVDA